MEAVKICENCGREIEMRRKWKECWDEIRYCSATCRRTRRSASDLRLEHTILELLRHRSTHATICPSEAARAVFPHEGWRDQMERTRRAARRLVAHGQIEIVQKGRIVDPSTAKGPIRLRMKS